MEVAPRWRPRMPLRPICATVPATWRHTPTFVSVTAVKISHRLPSYKNGSPFQPLHHTHFSSQGSSATRIQTKQAISIGSNLFSTEAVCDVETPLLLLKISTAFVTRTSASVYIGASRIRMATRAELDRMAHEGETVVPGGAGGHSLEAQEHLAQGRHKGGETRAQQLGHEGFVEMGKKGGLARHGADPYQAAIKQGVEFDEHKFMSEASIEELNRRAREGETVVPGGTGGHSLEAQKHLAEGRHKGGVNHALHSSHEGSH